LDNRPVPAKHLSADPPITGLLTPQQVAQLYNFPSGTGLGQTIGIFTAWVAAPNGVEPHTNTNGYQLDDVTATLANWGVTAAPPKDFPHGSNPGSPTEYYAEPVMDIAIATAVAPKASIVVYFMPEWSAAAIISTLTSMVHPVGSDPVPTVLSISYWFSADDDTSFLSPEDYTQIDTLFQDAANLGVTVLAGSNDYGAYFSSPTQAQTVYPASDPYVLTCGGTTIGDINGSTTSTSMFGMTRGRWQTEIQPLGPPEEASAPFSRCLLIKLRLITFRNEMEPGRPVAAFLTWPEMPARIVVMS